MSMKWAEFFDRLQIATGKTPLSFLLERSQALGGGSTIDDSLKCR